MTIYRPGIKIRCDECHFEYPDEHHHGEMVWFFVDVDGERQHFCSFHCFEHFKKYNPAARITTSYPLSSLSDGFKQAMKEAEKRLT